MSKKENRIAVRQAAEKAVIRDEQNRRIQQAATAPVKEVLKDLHTALCGLDEERIARSRSQYGSNRVTHEKKEIVGKAAGGCICEPLYGHFVLLGRCLHHYGYDFSLFLAVRKCAGGF